MMKEAERAKALVHLCSMCEPYALGWRAERVARRIASIERFAAWDRLIPVEKRRRVGRKALELLTELQELGGGGLCEQTLSDLAALAQGTVKRAGRGGDRRSAVVYPLVGAYPPTGEYSAETSMHRMIVRLWVEANERGGFSVNGPLTKFATSLCGFLGVSKPTDEALRNIHKEIKPAVKKIRKGSLARAMGRRVEAGAGGPIKF